MNDRTRVAALEQAVRRCDCERLPPVVRLRGGMEKRREPEPPEGAGVCPRCGRDREIIVQFVSVEAPRIGKGLHE